jgi:ParB family chromosome partitioning protein
MSTKKPTQSDKRKALTSSILDLAGSGGTPLPSRSRSKSIVGSALEAHEEGLADRIASLEAERTTAIADGVQLIELDPDQITDNLPRDRIDAAFEDDDFERFTQSISEDGQYVPILVRRAAGKGYEIAAGRRRLAACRALGRKVLARVTALDDDAMLTLQYRENAERENISTFERAQWLAAVAKNHGLSTTDMATRFDMSQPSVVEYLKIARLPAEFVAVLHDPRDLTIADGRKLHAALKDTDGDTLKRMVVSARNPSNTRTSDQIRAALSEVSQPRKVTQKSKQRKIMDANGSRIATITESGKSRSFQFDNKVEEGAVTYVAEHLADLIAEWRKSNS